MFSAFRVAVSQSVSAYVASICDTRTSTRVPMIDVSTGGENTNLFVPCIKSTQCVRKGHCWLLQAHCATCHKLACERISEAGPWMFIASALRHVSQARVRKRSLRSHPETSRSCPLLSQNEATHTRSERHKLTSHTCGWQGHLAKARSCYACLWRTSNVRGCGSKFAS